jgi:ribokinase
MTGRRRWDIVGVGDTDVDVYLRVPRIPQHDEKLMATLQTETCGGMMANYCVAASRLGASVALVSVVGDDAYGHLALDELSRTGVDTTMVECRQGGRTYFCVIHLDATGEKALTIVPTDCMFPSAEQVDEVDVGDARLLHLAAADLDVALSVARRARERSTLVSLDIEPSLVESDRAKVVALLNHVDIATANDAGFRALTGSTAVDPGTLLEFGPQVAVITRGAEGALGATADERVEVPAFPVDAIDTTGAGDCFGAALAVASLEGWALRRSLRFASAAAAISVTRIGGHTGAPSSHDVETFLTAQASSTT